MISCMKRIRIYFDADETLRFAIRTAALRKGQSASSLIEEVLAREFAKEVHEAKKYLKDKPGLEKEE